MASVAGRHAEWLSLLEVNGPFLSMQVLLKAFPQGLDAHDSNHAQLLRNYYDEWVENQESYRSDPAIHRAWIDFVLKETLGFTDDVLLTGQGIPEALSVFVALENETLRPDFVLVNPAGSTEAGPQRLLIQILPISQGVEKSMENHRWKASPASRMLELLKATKTRLGLVTNGEEWMLVNAPPGESTGYIKWTADLWVDEPSTLQAFRSLLSLRRFFGVDDSQTIESLLNESLADQQEVTDQLGYQVRKAVEVFIQAFDRIDQDRNRELLSGASATFLYEAALTVMMRLVFLLSAEERGLFMLGEEMYDQHYAVSTLRAQLRETADQQGEEVLSRRSDAWCRLLATFRAVYGGVEHDALRLPAYGGSLFDPDRFPFLEGRPTGTNWRDTTADPLPISNQIVLHLLEALQILRVKVPGGPPEPRRLSFSALGVEQIGHVYEGLLDHTAVRAISPVLGLAGSKAQESELSLEELERLKERGEKDLLDHLKKVTGRQASTIKKALDAAADGKLLDDHLETQRLLQSCNNDAALCGRVRPWIKLLRRDSMDFPVVINTGSLYVTSGDDRRSTGTHYTPPTLTEPIVKYTLEPLVYIGPAGGIPETEWKLRSAKEILDLKVCDMAMGSGAFLVQACRYLAEKLVEAWEYIEAKNPGAFVVTPEGGFSTGSEEERLLPADVDERILIARRYVADKCLYGVDRNQLAVEMAKLSVWLVTLRRDRPFTFLDHALKCGDSLLGVTTLEQIEDFSLRGGEQQITFATINLFRYVEEAASKRRELELLPSEAHDLIETKARLHAEAEAATAKVKAVANFLIAFELRDIGITAYGDARTIEAERIQGLLEKDVDATSKFGGSISRSMFLNEGQAVLNGRHPFHWPLEFPEVFQRGGFDAFVGNPPFMGGQKITRALGTDYRDYLVVHLANGKRGSADLCAYFFLRAYSLLRKDGGLFGLLATNTIAQGDTREVGLEQLLPTAAILPRAVQSRPWPGVAALEVAHVWLYRGLWTGTHILNEQPVKGITAFLTAPGSTLGKPFRLVENAKKSSQGSIILGMGFVLEPVEATALIEKDRRNSDVLFPYLNGEDVNSRYDQSPSRWVINFFDWPLDRSAAGSWKRSDDEERKEWLRLGHVPSDYTDSVAADYPDCLKIVEQKVKPERTRKDANGNFVVRYPRCIRWWQFAERAADLYVAAQRNSAVAVACRVTKFVSHTLVAPSFVYDVGLNIFTARPEHLIASLSSAIYDAWVRKYASSLETRVRYTLTDCFETFPFPFVIGDLERIGASYNRHRQSIMLSRKEGLTDTYNRFHDAGERLADILQLRALHEEMDQAVAAAYGWSDLDLGHGFHETKQGVRFTISEPARREVLDRLLQLNHERYAEEVRLGLHDEKRGKVKRKEKSLAGAKPADSKLVKPQLFE